MSILGKFRSKIEQAIKDRGTKKTERPSRIEEKLPKEETRIEKVADTQKKKETGDAYKILIRPLVTEKTAAQAGAGKYVFVVAGNANKIEIKKAVKSVYDVLPTDVNIVKNEGKRVRFGRHFGKRKDWKKAIVTLPKGKTLPIYE